MEAAAGGIVDQNLYSRQLGVFGMEAMGKLVKLDVLLVGLRGLGVEIAKNIILAGPKSVTLFDPEPATVSDTGCNYYITKESIGQSRAAASVEQLAELNNYVHVSVLPAPELTESIMSKFHCVVFTNTPQAQLVRWSDFCHAHSPAIGFIAADVRGVAGYVFTDFGPKHVIRDANGELNKSAIVIDISKSNPAVVFTHDGKRHGFSDGDAVVFHEVEGMTSLNDGTPRRISNVKPFSFALDVDTTAFPDLVGTCTVEQAKVPTEASYAPLSVRLASPLPPNDPLGMLITPDLSKFGRSEQLHVAFRAIELFRARHGALPAVRNRAHAEETVALAREWAASLKGQPGALQVEEVDAAVVSNVALLCQTELPALAAFFGGVVAQEIVKLTGKFTPLAQFLYLDAFEVLPPADTPEAEFVPTATRYDNVIAIFGRSQQTVISNQKVFVVGSGALGCEFLKNFAMMGVGAGPAGRITVTDMDRIEVSNLNRQFLFRSYNVGAPKSVTAAAAARAMNADLKVEALEVPVGEDTEGTFDDAFWESLDLVTNALDNLRARQYVDGRCTFYAKPLLESGTLGTKANTQVVVPYKTECYSDSQDPPEESIPMCTLRNFPHAIEHCIEWARDLFAGSFANAVQDAAAFLANPAAWLRATADESNMSTRRTKLEGVVNTLTASKKASFAMCVQIARQIFHSNFYLQIRQLLHNFPADYTDSNGVKFWSGPKRAPTPLVFDPADPLHFEFTAHAAALAAANYCVPLPAAYNTHAVLDPILAGIHMPEFVPKSVKIKADDNDQVAEGADDDRDAVVALTGQLEKLAEELGADGLARIKLAPADFEKDDDSNHHIDFIAGASNLRARNYKIKEAGRHEVKMTAGKIIPAIATTTCAVTGLVCIEMYKLIAKAPVDAYRNSFINLAVNVFSMSEPGAPKLTKTVEFDPISCGPVRAQPNGFTRWDRIVVKEGNLTPAQLEAWLAEHQKVQVNMITCGKSILYNPMLYKSHREQRANKPLKQIYQEQGGADLGKKKYLLLELSAYDDDGDVLLPQVQLYFG